MNLHTDEPSAPPRFDGAASVSSRRGRHARAGRGARAALAGANGTADLGGGATTCALRGARGGQRRRAHADVRELGVHTLDGGPTLNPSTYELRAGIREVPAEEVVVLPGSADVVTAAERAAELLTSRCSSCPPPSRAAGLVVAVALRAIALSRRTPRPCKKR